ncbi:heat shock protein DNAJ, putative [Trypanosoma vivax Y486]|uniref:Heat shock protein DNAJ, putative n=1 Tax=Trypanosoma vivax (strain Y486) TaxID=1055687 RepID=F9WMR9_TRYVY|nr:heat shock protein DNAJ, putative [Trypanosoma vivax Y486]|eukprot:CCD18831.1 heat shock protein DNAJ, putative [Trypanosoma vivax Y486]
MRPATLAKAISVALPCLLATLAWRMAAAEADEEDYYSVLGLGKEREEANERDIKSAWRKLSKKYRPDLSGESNRKRYQRIQQAYEVLGDRRKRKIYDILGVEGAKDFDKTRERKGRGGSLLDSFASFFGGSSHEQHRGNDEELPLVVPLEDLYTGASHTVKLPRIKLCRACRGTGARSKTDVVSCPRCKGKGRVVQRFEIIPGFVQQVERECDHCGGHGHTIKERCPVCQGRRMVRGTSSISIDIEQGTPNGHKLTYELEGDQRPGIVPGDVIFTVSTAPHPQFRRTSDGASDKADDLATTLTLTLKEALLGFNRTIKHLDGRAVELSESGVTKYGETRRVKGEGMPRHHVPSERGDLLVTYLVMLPKTLTRSQREAVERALS